MGMLSTQSEPTIHHFSHHHPLNLINHNPNLTLAPSSCSGCKVPLTQGQTYTCTLCNYFLHIKCSQMPQLIKHPCDQSHVFSLLSIPKYPEGVFKCDACGDKGSGFSYHCKDCGTDLHILCASMPLSTTHNLHCHSLNLIFSPPYLNKSFSCDVCKKNGGNHWLYRCNLCEFDAHLGCGTSKALPAQAHAMAQMHQYQQTPSVSVPVVEPMDQVHPYVQQFLSGYRAAPGMPTPGMPTPGMPTPGMPTPGRPLMDVAARMHQHLPQQTSGVPVPIVQPTGLVHPYLQQFLPGYRAPTPGSLQMNQHPFHVNAGVTPGPYYNQNANAAFQTNIQGTPSYFPNAPQNTNQQTFQGQMPAHGGGYNTTLQALQLLLGNGGGGGNLNVQLLQAILDASNNGGGGGDTNAQLFQSLMNGGGGGNDQLIQSLMGGGGFDVSSLLGGGDGGFDVSSLMGLMGGFGLS